MKTPTGVDGPEQRTAYYEHAQAQAEARIDDGEPLADVIFGLVRSLTAYDAAAIQNCKHVPWTTKAWAHRCMYCGATI
jgi:hypothetical protein